ncbi:LysR family transcriptional regulator [Raoultella terrigena]|uniref:LysR family transcriptional regulator n=1 Tax=Raoultella terrigena TaxID=577 RepID=UPI002DBE450B|nr:LysR family transcriptional regulator [Raoultella terrigena]MEB7598666.1 LysR family transcriptional regulator [Raoultella terrigena]
MRMSVKQLRAFLAVAHTLNFAHASERLNLSQPALSLTIKGLEEVLGGSLLQRSTRKVTLTQEGEIFLPMARQLLADWDNAEEAMRQSFTLQRGKISIAAMPSFAANVLKAFRDRYAAINVTVHDVINEQVIEMVREGRVEMGIAFEPAPTNNLLFTPLAVDRFVAIVPKESPLASKSHLSWRELLTLDFITLQRPSAVRLMLEEELARSGRKLDVALESHQLVTVGRMVASGLGGSAVPALCRSQMAALGAVCLPLDNPPIEKCIGVIHAGHMQLSKAAQALLDTLKGFLPAWPQGRYLP